jgi:hypothetical protein
VGILRSNQITHNVKLERESIHNDNYKGIFSPLLYHLSYLGSQRE